MTALDLQAGVEALSSAPPSFLARYHGETALELSQGPDETAALAGDEACAVVFAGELLDRERLGAPDSSQPRSDAETILAAYRARGEQVFGDLRDRKSVV